jgi:sensor domain CHASE-containing protein
MFVKGRQVNWTLFQLRDVIFSFGDRKISPTSLIRVLTACVRTIYVKSSKAIRLQFGDSHA